MSDPLLIFVLPHTDARWALYTQHFRVLRKKGSECLFNGRLPYLHYGWQSLRVTAQAFRPIKSSQKHIKILHSMMTQHPNVYDSNKIGLMIKLSNFGSQYQNQFQAKRWIGFGRNWGWRGFYWLHILWSTIPESQQWGCVGQYSISPLWIPFMSDDKVLLVGRDGII